MKNVIIAATVAILLGFGLGAWYFRGGDSRPRASGNLEAQEEQLKRLSELMRLQEEKLQKLGRGAGATHFDKLTPEERRKNREHAYKQVMELTRKVAADLALPSQEAKPFTERAELYARSFTALYYDEANDEMSREDRRRRLQELVDVLNQDMKQILTEDHYKQYWLIIRKYQLAE